MLKINIIDSCFHFKTNSLKNIKHQLKILKKYKVKKALCMFDDEFNEIERQKFYKNISKYSEFTHVPILNKFDLKVDLGNRFKNYKIIKINPRILDIRIENKKFYINLFKKISETNLTLFWCTFDSYENIPCNIDQLNFLSQTIPYLKNNKIILLHGGGASILRYYERFRFCKNVFIDLSYTFNHFYHTSLYDDFVFLINNFDKRLTFGSDYPTINYAAYKTNLNNFFKNKDITDIKKQNVLYNNLNNLLNE